jgi:hypothetical protein
MMDFAAWSIEANALQMHAVNEACSSRHAKILARNTSNLNLSRTAISALIAAIGCSVFLRSFGYSRALARSDRLAFKRVGLLCGSHG